MTKTNDSEPNRLYQSLNLYSLLKTNTGKQLGNKIYIYNNCFKTLDKRQQEIQIR